MARSKRKKNKADERLISWRNGRAYGDFRSYADVRGRREALAQPGKTWGTTDPDIANVVYDARLAELKESRRKQAGVESSSVKPTTLAKLVRLHLIRKAEAADPPSDSHMNDLDHRLRMAVEFFGQSRDPRTIDPDDVQAWAEHLAAGGTRGPGTVRHYLNALSGLYGRAQEGRHVEPGYNAVQAMQEKPTGMRRTEAEFFEVSEATLLLEAARIMEAENRKNATPALHAIIATFLLTGGRKAEVLGLDVKDVSSDQGLIRFRPNAHRRLKTSTSHRTVPLWPQLREILQAHVFERGHVSGLLFPSASGGMVDNLRKSFDEMGRRCGIEPSKVRNTKTFRHTYCTVRLQTVERILRPGRDPSEREAWDFVEVPRDRVARELGHGGTKLVERIYGHAPRHPYRSEAVEYLIDRHRAELGERLNALEAKHSRPVADGHEGCDRTRVPLSFQAR